MNQRLRSAAALLFSLSILNFTGLVRAAPPPTAASELADRLERMSYYAVQNYQPIPPVLHEAATMLEAAHRLNPTEPRYLRLLYQARLQAKDADGAVAALNAYLQLLPRDEFAQVKLINLYVSRMQTADAILSYLHGVVTKIQLPAPVRAHAAVLCAQTLLEHAQKAEALKMLDTALQIDPLNNSALKSKFRLTQDDGPSRRIGLLLAILRSNPLDPDAATQMANDLAALGLPEESAIWYSQAASLYGIVGESRSSDLGKGAATELYLCNHAADAAVVLDTYLKSVPTDADGWTIRLAIARDLGSDPAAFDGLCRQAITGVTDRLQEVRSALHAPNATTQPSAPGDAAPPTPDLSGDMALLVKANNQKITDEYISAAGDLAWLRLYYLRDAGPQTQQILDALAKMLPADDVELTRLQGWSYFIQSKWPEARQKLSAVADRDPFAAMGMVALDEQAGDKKSADALARTVMATHPSGSPAAVLYSEFRARGAKVMPSSQADVVRAELKAFPGDWLGIITQPQGYYTVTAAPVASESGLGEPILGRVTFLNTGNYDISMGEEGVLHPDLIFNAGTRGLIEQQMPGAIFDQMWQRLVLPKGQSCTQVFRLDRGPVEDLLDKHPEVPIDLAFSVMTNPVQTKQGVTLGGAGYESRFTSMPQRTATPIITDADRQALYARIVEGPPTQRLSTIEAVATLSLGLRGSASGDNAGQTLAVAKDMLDHARQGLADSDHAVRAWTGYLFVLAASPEQQQSAVQSLTTSDDWYARLLGLAAAQRLPDHGAVAASVMAGDPDPTVKEYAKAITDYLAAAATAQQQAATQPAAGQ
jgi:tetratricopeptide (TPR) repeat protein